MAGRLDGKVAVITGAASGIGRGTLELMVAEGAQVLAADLQADAGAMLEAQFPGAVAFQACDVTKPAEIKAAIDAAAARFGGLDILFNNAGSGGAGGGPEDVELDGWDQTHALLLRSVVAGTKFAVPHMKARGGGAIVNTSSISALEAGWAPLAYSVAKAAVLHYARVAAAELSQHRIRINAVVPGFIATSIFGASLGLPREVANQMAALVAERSGAQNPIGRAGEPADIAEAVVYLCADSGRFVTGTHLIVDGGITLGPRHAWDAEAANPLLTALGISPEQAQAMRISPAARS